MSDRLLPVMVTRPEKFLSRSCPPARIDTVRSTRSVSFCSEAATGAAMVIAPRRAIAVREPRGDHGYDTEFAVGVTAASATLGPIIPPSLPFVIYGMMGNVSIGALFLGGFIPGAVMTTRRK